MAKLLEFVWEYLRPLLGIKYYSQILYLNSLYLTNICSFYLTNITIAKMHSKSDTRRCQSNQSRPYGRLDHPLKISCFGNEMITPAIFTEGLQAGVLMLVFG